MVVFLIPVAVVGYKIWEKRRQEQEDERLKQQFETLDTAASSDSDVASPVAAESSLPQSSASAPTSAEKVEVAAFESRQNALLRSWGARASELVLVGEQSTLRDTYSDVASSVAAEASLLQSSASTPTSVAEADTETSEVAPFELKQNAFLRSWGARASEGEEALTDGQFASRDLHDLQESPTSTNAAEMEASLLRSWSRPSGESAVIVSPVAPLSY